MQIKIIFGALAAIIGLIGYVPYLRDTLRKQTKPHVFSWLIWGILTAIAFFAQLNKGGGPGAWASGLSAVVCFIVTFLSLRNGNKEIKLLDWISLAGASLALVLWFLTREPLLTVILITIIDIFGFIPTFRKAFDRPYEETLVQYLLASFKWIFAIAALSSINLATLLFPLTLSLMNGSFTLMLYIRRKIIHETSL